MISLLPLVLVNEHIRPFRYGHAQVSVDGLSGLQINCSMYTEIATKD